MVLVRTDYETALKYENTGCVTKIGNKKQQVLFKLYCDALNLESCIKLYKRFPNVVVLEYQGDVKELSDKDLGNVRVIKTYEFGTNICEDDISDVHESLPKGVLGMIKVPSDYSDMKFVYNMSQKYDNLRFCGGLLFKLDGCNLGCCDCDLLDKAGIKYGDPKYLFEGCTCCVDSYGNDEVELEEGKPLKHGSSHGHGGGQKKANKKTVKMQELLSQFGSFDL